jgi:hypothetical protein
MPLNFSKILIYSIFAFLVGFLFYSYSLGLSKQFLLNADFDQIDQGAYLNASSWLIESNFTNLGDRNRMPIFPLLLILVHNDNKSIFFINAKLFNIFLSLLFLIILFYINKKYLGSFAALNFVLIAAFGLYIFRAPQAQSEPLFYFLYFLSFLILNSFLIKPTLLKAFLGGITLGLAQLTKSFILSLFILFIVLFSFKIIIKSLILLKNKNFLWRRWFSQILFLILTIFYYLLIISPYLIQTKLITGRYFFNLNSSYYMWYDSWADCQKDINFYQKLSYSNNIDHSLIPGPIKYLKTHSLPQIKNRLTFGLATLYRDISFPPENLDYHNFSFFVPILGIILLILIFVYPAGFFQIVSKYFLSLIFSLTVFIFYLLLIAWYVPIADGPRFILTLFLPLIFCLYWLIYKLTFKYYIVINKLELNIFKIINIFIFSQILFYFFAFTNNEVNTIMGSL